MEYSTKVLPYTEESVHEAAVLLQKGEIVGIPTETVYGLAGSAYDEQAIAKIFKAKGRPQDNPLIVHISDLDMLPELTESVPETAKLLADAFWPGPLTMIIEKSEKVPFAVTAGLDTVAIRMPSHPAAAEIIRVSGLPLAAPSANTSGRPSPTKAEHVYHDMNGKIPLIIDGGDCEFGVESSVFLIGDQTVRLLRPGAVTKEQVESLGIKVEVDPAVEHMLKKDSAVVSPGLKYKHYSPKADVTIVKGSIHQFAEYVNNKKSDGVFALVFHGEEEKLSVPAVVYGFEDDSLSQASELFDALRSLDRLEAKTVFARCPKKGGVGLAVYNRLLRAAGFKVVDLE